MEMANKLFNKIRLFTHLTPNAILYLTLFGFIAIIITEILEIRFPCSECNAEKINLLWSNTLYAIFTSGLFYIILFGTHDYRRAVRLAPYVIAKSRELVGYINGGLYTICHANDIKYEVNETPSIQIFERLAELDPTLDSNEGTATGFIPNVGLTGQEIFSWYEALNNNNLKIAGLADETIASINSLNFPDDQLLQRIYYIKTSPFITFIGGQAKAVIQINKFAASISWYKDLIDSSFELNGFLNMYYKDMGISVERKQVKNEAIEALILGANAIPRRH